MPDEKIQYDVHNYEPVNKYIDVIQVPFNAMDRRLIDNNFFEVARENNKKVFILILKKEKISNPAHQLLRASIVTTK